MLDLEVFPSLQLGDLVEILDSQRIPLSSEEREKRKGDVPYYGANGLVGTVDQALFNEPLILMAEDGGNFDDFRYRPIAYRIDGPSWVNNHAHILRAASRTPQSFIYWAVVHKDIRRYIAGGTRAKLNQSELKEIEIRVPNSREAELIAQILNTLDTQIQKTEALIAKLEKIKEGLLHDLLTRGIDQDGQLRPTPVQAPELYKESALGSIPKEWEVMSLGQVTDSMVDGPFGSNLKTSHYVEEAGVQVVRLQNIKTREYDETFTAFITRAHANRLDRNRVIGGDLLVASLGDERSKPGRACLYPTHLPPAINKADCFRVRAHPSTATNSFLMHSLNFERSMKQATSKQQGVTLQRVNLSNLRTIVIGLPTIAEQRLISEQLNSIARKISGLECDRQKLESTKNGLMDDLLTGRVRVTPLLKDAV